MIKYSNWSPLVKYINRASGRYPQARVECVTSRCSANQSRSSSASFNRQPEIHLVLLHNHTTKDHLQCPVQIWYPSNAPLFTSNSGLCLPHLPYFDWLSIRHSHSAWPLRQHDTNILSQTHNKHFAFHTVLRFSFSFGNVLHLSSKSASIYGVASRASMQVSYGMASSMCGSTPFGVHDCEQRMGLGT